MLLIALCLIIVAGGARAETNISAPASDHSAWNDGVGWLDLYGTNTVLVGGSKVAGYASSSVGIVSLDCATSPNGNVCTPQGDYGTNYGVCNGYDATHQTDGSCPAPGADASGNLSGWAWNDTVGWVSVCGGRSTSQCPGTVPYGVTISKTTGDFEGWAWNDMVGWVSFNCANSGASCSPAAYKVNTAWRSVSSVAFVDSSIVDTQASSGVVLNSITWQGSLPDETRVEFQIATSSSPDPAGPWNFVGPDGTTGTFYGAPCSVSFIGGVHPTGGAPNTPVCVNPATAQGRYLRYRIRLMSNLLQTTTPQIDDVILNWSR